MDITEFFQLLNNSDSEVSNSLTHTGHLLLPDVLELLVSEDAIDDTGSVGGWGSVLWKDDSLKLCLHNGLLLLRGAHD